jgi:hypothetical protein
VRNHLIPGSVVKTICLEFKWPEFKAKYCLSIFPIQKNGNNMIPVLWSHYSDDAFKMNSIMHGSSHSKMVASIFKLVI